MPTPTELRDDFNTVIDENGTSCTIRNYPTITFTNTGYDDEQLISASGTLTSGGCVLMPIGPSDREYFERGLVTHNDSKLYLAGSIGVSGNSVITVGNTGSMFEVLPQGVKRYDVSGTTIYQIVYARNFFSGQHVGIT